MSESEIFDVAIVGGGPAGSTAGILLKKYNPSLRVAILEREVFPRDHVGESLLPSVSRVLDELGVWNKMEAANFPIKVGATYKWGASPELWDFEFTPSKSFPAEERPAKYEGKRLRTAFQVDRAIYDKILLDQAAAMGCEVRQGAKVAKIPVDGDRVLGFELESGARIEARHYLDASGHTGVMRRALGVEIEQPTSLQNIAIWDYWQNADWAVEIGIGGTKVQVMSLGYGWIWFIPLGPTRTSVGLVVPAEYYKKSGGTVEDLYAAALKEEPRIASLMKNASSEGRLSTTKDWSFVAKRFAGQNWFLVGESAGFADPVLAAGLTIAHYGALEGACTVLELERGTLDPEWLRETYELRQRQRIMNHVRFADYWYTANTQFKDLKDFTAKIASENGLSLSPEQAWAWLAQGGFIEDTGLVGIAGYAIDQMRSLHSVLMSGDREGESVLAKTNNFVLNLEGGHREQRGVYQRGSITPYDAIVREGKTLPLIGVIKVLLEMLSRSPKLTDLHLEMTLLIEKNRNRPKFMNNIIGPLPNALEGMIADGWVLATHDPSQPLVPPPSRDTGIGWSQP